MSARLGKILRALLAVLTISLAGALLVSTNTWNPVPPLVNWWHRFMRLSDPDPAWESRAGGVIDIAAVMSTGQVVIVTRGFVDGYARDGTHLWHYQAYFVLPARDVVVMRRKPENPDVERVSGGYQVIEPASGATVWSDDDAIAVWAFADRIMDVLCTEPGGCRLRARTHANGSIIWTVPLPGGARTILGPAPGLAGVRDPSGWPEAAVLGSPRRLPTAIGLMVGGRVHVIDTVHGVLLREVAAPDRATRVVVTGERLIFSRAVPGNPGCQYTAEAFDIRTGASVWRADGLDLDTSVGAGCEQRRDPIGVGSYLIARLGDNRPAVVAVRDGGTVWAGAPGEKVIATDGELAVVRAPADPLVRVIDLLDPDRRVVWSGQLGSAEAAVAPAFVVLRDRSNGKLTLVNHLGGGTVAELTTKSQLAGYGDIGLIISSGRRFGFLPLSR